MAYKTDIFGYRPDFTRCPAHPECIKPEYFTSYEAPFPHYNKILPHFRKTTKHLRRTTFEKREIFSNVVLPLMGTVIFKKLEKEKNRLLIVSKAAWKMFLTCIKYAYSHLGMTTSVLRKRLSPCAEILMRAEKILLRSEIILRRQEKIPMGEGKILLADKIIYLVVDDHFTRS